MTEEPEDAKSCVPSPKSQKNPEGLAIVPSSTSLLVEPSRFTANAEQFKPVKGTQSGDPSGTEEAMKRATGGLFVIVSVAFVPLTTGDGIKVPVLSTNLMSLA